MGDGKSVILATFKAWRMAALMMTSLALCQTALGQSGYVAEFVYPQCGQGGTTVDVTVEGVYLHEPEQVLFYQSGIRCTHMEPTNVKLDINSGEQKASDSGSSVKLTLEIAEDATPGEYQFRIRTRDGLSEMLTFWVTPFPVVMEQHAWVDSDGKRNDSAETAQAIDLNSTVVGYIPGRLPQDDDWFSTECRKGQRLSVDVVANRLGTLHYGGLNDPAVRIVDSAGNELGRNDDNALHSQDPVLSVLIPDDGTYFIHMHQQMDYEAGRLRHYLLHVGTFPRPIVSFPLGGKAGTAETIRLLGDVTGDLTANIQLPNLGLFEENTVNVFGNGPSPSTSPPPPTPNRIHSTPFESVTESTERQSTPEVPHVIEQTLPLAINGTISSEGEVDWYRVSAKKGERYRVVGYGKTFDSELDGRIWIKPARGNVSKLRYDQDDSHWDAHDVVGHHYRHQRKLRLDPVFMFEPDTDGDWLVGIGDTRREFGPHHIYRIEFQPHVDSTFVHFPAYPSLPTIVRDRIVLFKGQSYSRPVAVQPGFGSQYNKMLQLRAVNLPDGVSMECSPFLQNAGIVPVTFAADNDASIGATLIDLIVEPVDPADRKNFRGGFIQNNQATNRRGDYAMYFNRTRRMALAVVGGSNFDLHVEQPKIPLVRSGELALDVTVQRREGYSGAIYCEADWLPPGVNKQPPVIIPAGKTHAVYRLSAASNAAPGEYPFSITGRENDEGNVRTGAGFHYVCSPNVRLTVGEPYVTITLNRAAIERGTIGEIHAEIAHHNGFSGKATLQLGRLPFGAEQVKPFPQITSADTSATFKVKVTSDCLVSQYKDVFCEVIILDGGQQIRQQTGSGLLRVDAERTKL